MIFLLTGQQPRPNGKQSILDISILIILDNRSEFHILCFIFCFVIFYLRFAQLVLLLPGLRLLFKSEILHCPRSLSLKQGNTLFDMI